MKLYSHVLVVLPVLLGFCVKQDAKDTIARIGTSSITKQHLESFNKITRVYPSKPNEYFPAKRPPTTFIIETEMLAAKATPDLKSKLGATPDWSWKKAYYPAQLYLFDFLVPQLGQTEEQLEAYYTAHVDSFKDTIKAADSTKKDSVYTKAFSDVKETIVSRRFLENNKPDSAFLKTLGDTLPPADQISQDWLNSVRSNPPLYFMKKFYKETYGKNYPDSLDDIFGDGKPITQKDFDVILQWIPEERREYFTQKQGKKELVEWLLKWKLFAAHAEKNGFTKRSQIKNCLDWAWKIEVATEYVNKVLLPKAKPTKQIDTMFVKYSYADDVGAAKLNPDSTELNGRIESAKKEFQIQLVDSMIYAIRKNAGVKFLQNDWKDNKAQAPSKLIAKADSLRDSAKSEQAEQIYNTLSTEFAFSPEGKRATIELAKLLTERQAYYQAIGNYRKYLIYGDDKSKFCNVFFMIGFIYDEYLDKPDLAEINYKYVLKYLPGCELTDDAEFMMLHLGEPMSSIEELQAEALRQGRKIEATDTKEESTKVNTKTDTKVTAKPNANAVSKTEVKADTTKTAAKAAAKIVTKTEVKADTTKTAAKAAVKATTKTVTVDSTKAAVKTDTKAVAKPDTKPAVK